MSKTRPASRSQPRRGLQEATFLERSEWLEAGAWLEAGVRESGKSDPEIVALMNLDRGPDRLRSYYRGEHLPTPKTLHAICKAASLSYVGAIDRFGYYREIVRIFDDLVWLGEYWMEEDNASGRAIRLDAPKNSRVDSIHYTGVLNWKGRAITWGLPRYDPREDPAFLARYFIGSWQEEMPIMARDTPKIVRDFVEQSRMEVTIVPKSIAIAILLAVLAFPWRGDVYNPIAPEYRERLGKGADPLIDESKERRSALRTPGRPKKLHPFLERACRTLDDSSIPFNSRRTIAAEYIVIWADSICQSFTHYARLAAFDLWGEPGGRPPGAPAGAVIQAVPGETTEATVSFPSIFSQLPQIRKATLPEIETLTT